MNQARRDLLRALFDAAVAAGLPDRILPPHLPPPPADGRLILLAGGKAAGAMLAAAVAHYRQTAPLALQGGRITGLGITRKGYGLPTAPIELVTAGHPVPDAAGLEATRRLLRLAAEADANDRIVVLLSGGASANWIAPVAGLDLDDKQAVTRALLASGATIGEINTVRRHLSRIKGGRLVAAAGPAPVLTLAISDVPGDAPTDIGSGPTVPDPTTLADARAVLARHGIAPSPPVAAALADPANETPKPGDPLFRATEYRVIARPRDALAAAAAVARQSGYEPVILGDAIEGEARDLAAAHAALALRHAERGAAVVLLSGGEATVTLRGAGRGGPNQEYALALALAFDGNHRLAAIAADTDGTDGGGGAATDPAGALVDGTTAMRARSLGLDPALFLYDNDSSSFFALLDDLLQTGPTLTNLNDFRALLVDRAKPCKR